MSRRDAYDDERVVVVEEQGANAVGMLLLGLAIGAGAALLFAPASGVETRARIEREARRAGRRVKEMTDDVTGEIVDRVGRTRAGFDERVERARSAMRSSRSVTLPRWKGDALSTHNTSAPAALAARAGSSNQASSQLFKPNFRPSTSNTTAPSPASRPEAK